MLFSPWLLAPVPLSPSPWHLWFAVVTVAAAFIADKAGLQPWLRRTVANPLVHRIIRASLWIRLALGIGLFLCSLYHWHVLRSLQLSSGFWAFALDSNVYHHYACGFTHAWTTRIPPQNPDLGLEYFAVVGSLYWLASLIGLPPHPLYAIVLNACLAAAATLLAYLVARRLFGLRAAVTAACLIGFWPSSLMWSSQLLKDSLSWFLIFLTLWSTLKVSATRSPLQSWRAFGTWLLLGLSIVSLTRLRFYLGSSLVIAMGLAFLPVGLGALVRGAWRRAASAFGMVLFVLVSVLWARTLNTFRLFASMWFPVVLFATVLASLARPAYRAWNAWRPQTPRLRTGTAVAVVCLAIGSLLTQVHRAVTKDFHLQSGLHRWRAGNSEAAIDELTLALAFGEPGASQAYLALGIIYTDLGQFDDALIQYRQYMALPGLTEAQQRQARHGIVLMHMANGDHRMNARRPDLAADSYVRALTSDTPTMVQYRDLAIALAEMGRVVESTIALRTARPLAATKAERAEVDQLLARLRAPVIADAPPTPSIAPASERIRMAEQSAFGEPVATPTMSSEPVVTTAQQKAPTESSLPTPQPSSEPVRMADGQRIAAAPISAAAAATAASPAAAPVASSSFASQPSSIPVRASAAGSVEARVSIPSAPVSQPRRVETPAPNAPGRQAPVVSGAVSEPITRPPNDRASGISAPAAVSPSVPLAIAADPRQPTVSSKPAAADAAFRTRSMPAQPSPATAPVAATRSATMTSVSRGAHMSSTAPVAPPPLTLLFEPVKLPRPINRSGRLQRFMRASFSEGRANQTPSPPLLPRLAAPILPKLDDQALQTAQEATPEALDARRRSFVLTGGHSLMDATATIRDPKALIRYLPRALVIGVLAPFPAQWFDTTGSTGSMRTWAGLEMILWYVLLLPSVLVGIPRAIAKRRPEAWLVLGFSLVTLVAISLVVANVGTLFRLRLLFLLPFLIITAASDPLGWYRRWLPRPRRAPSLSPQEPLDDRDLAGFPVGPGQGGASTHR